MSTTSSRSVSRSGTPLGTRPHSTNTTTTSSSLSSLPQKHITPPTGSTSSLTDGGSSSSNNNNNYFSYPVGRVVSGLYRRLTDPPQKMRNKNSNNHNTMNQFTSSASSLFTPKRTASPFQPPPLTPLTLRSSSTQTHQHILSRALAEEIRLLVPPRLQLVDTWRLAYSLERDGSSLSTLYDNCRQVAADRNPRAGYVLVVRDSSDGGAVFGAYLTDAPHPSSHFYGTGECFLWRASVLASTPDIWSNNGYPNHGHNLQHQHNIGHDHDYEDGQHEHKHEHKHEHNQQHNGDSTDELPIMTDEELQRAGFPPPPSADTTHAVRSTTLRASTPTLTTGSNGSRQSQLQSSDNNKNILSLPGEALKSRNNSGTSTPERIRFKAFPYSGMNDYMMFCETGFLSVGGG